MELYLPILIVVVSNTIYQICAKSISEGVNTFASLSVTYAVGAAASVALYFLTSKNADLIQEYRQLNWSSFVLGLCIVGLEAGFILMYKIGWSVSTGQTVASAFLAVVLIAVGRLLYNEAVTMQKVIGVAVCLAGLYLINKS